MRLPRQLVACAMVGQVGVESTGVCGPVRAEAGDWHTAHAAHGGSLLLIWQQCWPLVHLLGIVEGRSGSHPSAFCGVTQSDSRLWKHHDRGNTWRKRICPLFICCRLFRLLPIENVACSGSCATSGLFVKMSLCWDYCWLSEQCIREWIYFENWLCKQKMATFLSLPLRWKDLLV